MSNRPPHRKTVRHYHTPGDFHELTFCCFHGMQLLTNERWRNHLARALDRAVEQAEFMLVAFVFMPGHVHLLVYPMRKDATGDSISEFLQAVKLSASQAVKADLAEGGSRLLERLTVHERPGKYVFRFWQEGPGYDRNLQTSEAVIGAIDYLHLNPVRRKLCGTIGAWKWSSARWYLSERREVDPDLPTIHGPPQGM